ncbi:MAG: hypothetical protein N2645_21205 [Clostridia bacterium]|nr:hypothetical protein [Clostridia bacterium]
MGILIYLTEKRLSFRDFEIFLIHDDFSMIQGCYSNEMNFRRKGYPQKLWMTLCHNVIFAEKQQVNFEGVPLSNKGCKVTINVGLCNYWFYNGVT